MVTIRQNKSLPTPTAHLCCDLQMQYPRETNDI